MSETELGPVGGHGGEPFDNYTIPENAHLTELHLFADNFINAIQIVYTTADGDQITMPRIGGKGGEPTVFTFEPDEYLTVVGGTCGWFIDSLYIGTNKRALDTIGGSNGEYEFHFNAPKGSAIVGFFGRSAWYIDKIGAIARELVTAAEPTPAAKPIAEETPDPALKETPSPPADPKPKDLQKIEGIGPKISSILVDAGIPDLTTLAQTPVEKIQEVLDAAGKRYRIADPTTWPEQAALGAKGAWDKLKKLQENLKGGRRKK